MCCNDNFADDDDDVGHPSAFSSSFSFCLLFLIYFRQTISIYNYHILYAVTLRHAKVNKTVGSRVSLFCVSCSYTFFFFCNSNADYFCDTNLFRSLHYKWIIKSSPDICDAISVVSAHSKFVFFSHSVCYFSSST